MFDHSPDEESLLDKLIEVSTFGLDDLELNRQGKMSGLQRSRLGVMTIIYFGVGAVLFAFAVGAIWVAFTQSHFVPFPAMLVWIILCTYGGIQWLYKALPMWQDFQAGTVLCVSGPLRQIYTRISGRYTIYTLHYRISKKFFDVAFFAPKFISQDQKCHAYYTPQSEILVGIEPI
jgi:hypothetical protein